MLKQLFLPPDVFFRHHLVMKTIRGAKKILDVGGSLGELKKFFPLASITTVDVQGAADVVYDGRTLPFPNRSFETVVSVDTIEHLAANSRISFLDELVRVAKKRVIVVAPYASAEHNRYEAELMERFKKHHERVPSYLAEHLRYGLVTDELKNDILSRYPSCTFRFAGHVLIDRINFRIHLFEFHHPRLNRLLYMSKLLWYAAENVFLSLVPITGSRITASRVIIAIQVIR